MKSFIKAIDSLPYIIKIILCIPALDIVWGIYRLIKSLDKGNAVGIVLAIVLLIPTAIALIACAVFKAQMKTARIQNQATEYVDSGSFDLRVKQDMFLHKSVVRVPIPKSEPSSGGTTVNSSGFSGRSGKF